MFRTEKNFTLGNKKKQSVTLYEYNKLNININILNQTINLFSSLGQMRCHSLQTYFVII